MPVQLPTTFGEAEYNVVIALNRLAAGINALEAEWRSSAGPLQEIRALRTQLLELTKRVDVLNKQVNP